jgi:hypothetical protein
MKVAVIPPRHYWHYVGHGEAWLGLAQMVDETYWMHHHRHPGQIRIMDNGAAEGEMVSNLKLLLTAKKHTAKEVVLPDELTDHLATMDKVGQFFKERADDTRLNDFDYVGVVQGRSFRQVKACIDYYASNPKITTLGVPRLLIDYMGPEARIVIANWVKRQYDDRFQIHLLGTNKTYPREVLRAALDAPHIRSVDTSLPFNFAIADARLEDNREIGRPHGYLDLNWSGLDVGLIQHNIATLKEWANGQEASSR